VNQKLTPKKNRHRNDGGFFLRAPSMGALLRALVTGVAKSFKLLLPNGNTATFTAYVKKFNSQGAVDQAIRRSAELRISGSITWA
jgi:hypothetical protein